DAHRAGRALDEGVRRPRRARPRRHRAVEIRHRRALLRPHGGAARQARRLRPDRPHPGRPRGRRAPHRRGHLAGDRHRPQAGPGGQGRHPSLRRRTRAAGRVPGAGRGRPVGPAVRRARGAAARRADRVLRHHADAAHLGVAGGDRRHRAARARAVGPQRPPRRGGAVQGRRARPARRGRARPARRRRPQHQGHAV
ncbi:MAG: Imidazoleglycerol-phosphate dehydratase, partial [uncultured Frankineae bacterium]